MILDYILQNELSEGKLLTFRTGVVILHQPEASSAFVVPISEVTAFSFMLLLIEEIQKLQR
jgi:hypothetical protein